MKLFSIILTLAHARLLRGLLLDTSPATASRAETVQRLRNGPPRATRARAKPSPRHFRKNSGTGKPSPPKEGSKPSTPKGPLTKSPLPKGLPVLAAGRGGKVVDKRGEDTPAKGIVVSKNQRILHPFEERNDEDVKMHYTIMHQSVVAESNSELEKQESLVRWASLGTMGDSDYVVVAPRYLGPKATSTIASIFAELAKQNERILRNAFSGIINKKTIEPAPSPLSMYPQGDFKPYALKVRDLVETFFPAKEGSWLDPTPALPTELAADPDKVRAALFLYINKGFRTYADCSITCFMVMNMPRDPKPGSLFVDMGLAKVPLTKARAEDKDVGVKLRARLKQAADSLDGGDLGELKATPGQCMTIFAESTSTAVYHFAGVLARDGPAVVTLEAWAGLDERGQSSNSNTVNFESWSLKFYEDHPFDPSHYDEDSADDRKGSWVESWATTFADDDEDVVVLRVTKHETEAPAN